MCTATRTSSYSPAGPSVFCVFSLGLYFVYSFVSLISVHILLFPWAVKSSPLVFGVSVTNLNEPPRALPASTIAWALLGHCKQKQRGLRGYYDAGPPLLNERCTSLLRAPVHSTFQLKTSVSETVGIIPSVIDTVGYATGRASSLHKTGCWLVGGDDLTGALHVLQLQLSLPPSSVSHGSAYTVVRAKQQVNGKWQFWGVRTP